MSSVRNSFAATGNGDTILVNRGETVEYNVQGTFVGTYVVQYSDD